MNPIKILPQELANQIAAGEVIERPASVVKELIENSIDAGATKIDIKISEAGRKLITVSDNGSGIKSNEIALAFKPHATSKLSSTFDLFRIQSLGFRGEALPSIASIAKVTVNSCTSEETGVSAILEDGEIAITPVATNVGTTIHVENLFYNTPARLKYLKLDYSENSVTFDAVSKIALAHPSIAFSLTFDDKLRFKTTGRGDLKETILNIYGLHYVKNILPISFSTNDFKLEGYLGNTELVRANRYGIIINLNGRNVYMGKIQAAIIEAYGGFIAPNRFPFVTLNLTVEPELVDVNVHPTKKEVRFSKEKELIELLLKNIPIALRKDEFVPTSMFQLREEQISQNEVQYTQSTFDLFTKVEENEENSYLPLNDSLVSEPLVYFKQEELNVFPVGSINRTYIICQTREGGFWLVDQHAAHERINYEKFQNSLNQKIKVRPLLVPLVLSFSKSEMLSFTDEVFIMLLEVGISASLFGENAIRVSEVPSWANEYDEKVYVENVIEQVLNNKKIDVHALRTNAIATFACKASIKAYHTLSSSESNYLLSELLKCDNPYSCPHGRPTIIKFTKYELEKMFKRSGA